MGFQWAPLPRGNRIALVTFSGAQAIMSIDRACELGLDLARFSPDTMDRLGTVISSEAKRRNPVDTYPDMNVHGFEKLSNSVLEALFEDDGVDRIKKRRLAELVGLADHRDAIADGGDHDTFSAEFPDVLEGQGAQFHFTSRA